MKSPFPGMDPYIEAHGRLWEDFHTHLISDIFRALIPTLPDKYVARTEVRAYIVVAETDEKKEHLFQSDIALSSPDSASRLSTTAESVAVAEPATQGDPVSLRAFISNEFRESFIEIYEDDPDRRLVTCIEVLSPSNKRKGTTGWEQYLRKRQGLLLGEANFVEIDLLRGGTRMPMLDPWPKSPYTILVSRRENAPYCKVWRGHSIRPLPAIPIPLSKPDADLTLELQPLVETIYAQSRYSRDIDYTRPLQPPLTDEESTWLAERLRDRAKA